MAFVLMLHACMMDAAWSSVCKHKVDCPAAKEVGAEVIAEMDAESH
jgi:hypothetical protein